MEENRGTAAYRQALRVLPPPLRQRALSVSPEEQERAEEVRLRVGRPLSLVLPWGERWLEGKPVTGQDLEQLVELASGASFHAVADQVRRGYLTVAGGHRIGLCGSAVLREGEMQGLRNLSSADLRIARQMPGAARGVLERLCREGRLESALILAPPGLGKTTLLRDLIRRVSGGEGCQPLRVALADERGEVAALYRGVPQLEVGPRTDVMEGCPKAEGLMMLLRGMNPQVLCADEITAPADLAALETAANCGVSLLATAHGSSLDDLRRRPLYRDVLARGIFQRLVTISGRGTAREYAVTDLEGTSC